MDKKIAVLGTGANGSCIAADLARAGRDVTLIDQWPDHVEAMRADGLTIRLRDQELHVTVEAHNLCDVCTLNHTWDVVLMCLKAYDTPWGAHFIRPYLADDGLLVGVQNAMTVDDIVAAVGPERTLGCVVELSSELFTPGTVKRNTPPAGTWFGIGALDPAMGPRVAEVAEILAHAGRVEVSDNIRSAKWMKLIVNAMTMGLKSILNATSKDAFAIAGVREIMLSAGDEALRVGQDLGYRIEPVFGLTREEMEGSNRLTELLLDKITHDVGPSAINTVLQDHLKGRLSEVEMINGLVVAESERYGRKAPVNQMIVEITRSIHAGDLRPDLSNIDLVRQALERETAGAR